MKASNAIILIATLCFTGVTPADEIVKSGGREDRPGRALDDDTVKSGGATDRPGRTLDDDTVKSGGRGDKPGRAVDAAK